MYNIALRYLQDKYGTIKNELIQSKQREFRTAKNKKEQKQIQDSLTDKDYIQALYTRNITNEDDLNILSLIKQYYYGIEPKKELYTKLLTMQIIKE